VIALETPGELARRLKLGREEFLQRLLTSLILDGPYPKWNTRSQPSRLGASFLRSLWERSFNEPCPEGDMTFVDEFDLPARVESESGGAPDYAVLWSDVLWLIELKTERASHRKAQLPTYFELGQHHHPACRVAITYVTPAGTYADPALREWSRYAHVPWDDVAQLVTSAWPTGSDASRRAVLDGVREIVAALHLPPSEWRRLITVAPLAPAPSPMEFALELARETADDGQQRALDHLDLEKLQELRVELREHSAASPHLNHVMPWLWSAASSGGAALTVAGVEAGYELRVSRYERPLY